MTVGETLTEARTQAGLSVDELSERTRIRGTVIRSIEQDDYEACGGDLYVRGYVRAIAGAVGIDAQPLIREFDFGRSGANERANGSTGRHARGYPSLVAPRETVDATRFDMPAVSADPAATSFDLPSVAQVPPAAPVPPAATPPGTADTRYDLTAIPSDPTQVSPRDLMDAGYDLGPAGAAADAAAGTQVMPAIAFDPSPAEATAAWAAAEPTAAWPVQEGTSASPANASGGIPRSNKRRGLFAVVAGVVVLAAAGVGIYLATGSTATTNTAAATASSSNAAAKASASAKASESAAAQASASAAAQASASAAAKASASASTKAKAAAAAQHVVSLPVASAMAFGPNGPADGDDASGASSVIAASASQPWATQWYSTATFGMLKHGTGIMLDLGSKVTVTTVRLDLAQFQGTNLQLRVGNSEALQNLTVAATGNNVGGAIKLTLQHPVAARYLLIWITQLPPDGAGHYRETISHVAVTGRR